MSWVWKVSFLRYSSLELEPPVPNKKKRGLAKKIFLGFGKFLGAALTGSPQAFSGSRNSGNGQIEADLLLYGGTRHRRFLGCLSCEKTDERSIWNREGEFGSLTGKYSIWNESGSYGSKYNTFSPWKKFSASPPLILDKNRNFYGYFTVDRFAKKRTTIEWILWILENQDYVREHYDEMGDNI